LITHLSKAGIRLAVNASPEPFSNVGVSLVEDTAVAGVILLALDHPWLAAGVALTLLVAAVTLVVLLMRRIRRALRALGARAEFRRNARSSGGGPGPPPPPS